MSLSTIGQTLPKHDTLEAYLASFKSRYHEQPELILLCLSILSNYRQKQPRWYSTDLKQTFSSSWSFSHASLSPAQSYLAIKASHRQWDQYQLSPVQQSMSPIVLPPPPVEICATVSGVPPSIMVTPPQDCHQFFASRKWPKSKNTSSTGEIDSDRFLVKTTSKSPGIHQCRYLVTGLQNQWYIGLQGTWKGKARAICTPFPKNGVYPLFFGGDRPFCNPNPGTVLSDGIAQSRWVWSIAA